MGTNFYLKRKLTKKQKEDIIDIINSDGDYDVVVSKLYDIRPIHIGKRSYGWKFLWNANDFKFFKPTKESLIEFLKSGQIINEYDDEFTFDQFWNEEYTNEGFDLTTYYAKYPEYQYHVSPEERNRFVCKHKITPNIHGEFYIDDLRFTTCSEFG